ncbi:tyrosyl-DNA phosphodiesterase 2-like isoform X2 [Palaemon carinicauda]|uniref:tyrosyl-DNA phosphodiesterase 2-like isoform X2 n=1 Tax=Palaemon carinicauda TaxID=392227 RepID=UPI0035B695F2
MSNPDVISLDNDSQEDESNIPDAKTCQDRVERFAAITGTDEALAQFFLQDRNWNLEASVNAFFESQAPDSPKPVKKREDKDVLVTYDSHSSGGPQGSITTEPPKNFRLITWNLDGLDEKNLKKRTKAVIKILEIEKADIVFLQELIPATYSYLEARLPQFHFIVGNDEQYFTATLLRRTTVYYDDHTVYPFDNTRMGRNLLAVQAHIGKVKLNLLNTHLESSPEFSEQRREQMKICFGKMKSASSEVTTLFGGDLNARDKEVTATIIPDAHDLWETCGRRPECRWTWDTQRNTNKEYPGRYKPKTRFDRVYLKQATPAAVTPKHFGLVGIQKVAGTQSFPSDHWGIIVHFQVVI